jgi:hypothetical protein
MLVLAGVRNLCFQEFRVIEVFRVPIMVNHTVKKRWLPWVSLGYHLAPKETTVSPTPAQEFIQEDKWPLVLRQINEVELVPVQTVQICESTRWDVELCVWWDVVLVVPRLVRALQ